MVCKAISITRICEVIQISNHLLDIELHIVDYHDLPAFGTVVETERSLKLLVLHSY